jgi:FkbM family methyltransferase
VVSIEPNPRCCEQLRRLAKVRDVHVEHCAAGDAPGKLKLRICDDSVLSTVAEDYYQEASKSPIHKDAHWIESVDVDVVTLDQHAERYGTPAFVKIDAEGYDDHVLRGMSFRPKALTFEYAHILPQVAARCFETPILSSGYEFNFSCGLGLNYASEKWLSGKELRERLPELVGSEIYGDVIARSMSALGATSAGSF